MCLNHPETIPYPICGKIVFQETGPWWLNGWGQLTYLEEDQVQPRIRHTQVTNSDC